MIMNFIKMILTFILKVATVIFKAVIFVFLSVVGLVILFGRFILAVIIVSLLIAILLSLN